MDPAISFLKAEADALDMEAARIAAGLDAHAPHATAKDVLERAKGHLGPMFQEEASAIAAVVMEHAGNDLACPVYADTEGRRAILKDLDGLVIDLENADDCTPQLKALIKDLGRYAAFQRETMLPFCAGMDADALHEANHRVRYYGRSAPMEGFEFDGMAA